MRDGGTNILLMGTGGRDTITRREKREFRAGGVACNCTDTLMLVHVSEARGRVGVVGLPRDRIQRQQRLLVAALSGLRTEKVLASLARTAQLSRTLLGADKVDQGFSDEELLSLASGLGELPTAHGDMSPQLSLVQGSLNKPCIGLPENSTQAKGDEPLTPSPGLRVGVTRRG